MIDALFPVWRADEADRRHRPRWTGNAADDAAALRVRWLGTACFVIETSTTTVVVDPFVSRPPVRHVALKKLVPDEAEVRRFLPTKVDAVVCGHSHYDHVLDGPILARRTGARFIGSPTAILIARAAGVPEAQLTPVSRAGATHRIGDVDIRLVPSLHGRFVLRRFYLWGGELDREPSLPARASTYKMGGAFGIVIRAAGLTLYHNGSADLIDAELDDVRADVLLVGLAGRQGTRDYLKRLVSTLAPRVIVPTHHDAFFSPLDRGLRLLPGIDLDGFAEEARRLAPNATTIFPSFDETIVVPAREARDAGIA